MNHAQKLQLERLIEDYAKSCVADSWKGSCDPADTPLIEKDLKDARRALDDVMTLRTTHDSERLSLLLETMLAMVNESALPPGGQLVMDAMQGHAQASGTMTTEAVKGILDAALPIYLKGAGSKS